MAASDPCDAVVVGCSAGGLAALRTILARLPTDFAPAIVIVSHVGPGGGGSMARILDDSCRLPVTEAAEKDAVESGRIYVAPADYHLLIESDRTFSLSVDPPVNFSRPSIDVLFEAAADVYGAALVGVLLTGANDDGARGLEDIVAAGGTTVVQDPATAEAETMPRSAIERGAATFVETLDDLAGRLISLAEAA